MKNIIIACLLLIFSQLAFAQNQVIIKGTVKGDLKGYNKVYIYGAGIERDSTLIKDAAFEFKIPYTKPFLPQLYCEYEAKLKDGLSPLTMFIDRPGLILIKDIDLEKGFHSGQMSGIKSVEDLALFNKKKSAIYEATAAAMREKFGNLQPNDPGYNTYLSELYAMNTERGIQLTMDYVAAHADEALSGLLLLSAKGSMTPEQIAKSYHSLSKQVQHGEHATIVAEYLSGLKQSATGRQVSEFILSDANDQPISISQFKGKYVVIDFWASWCGPCIQSFPQMKEIYKKYAGSAFDIYSISIDQSKKDWLAGLTRHELPWIQALDTKKVHNSIFGVSAVPTLFLIDPNGKILLRESGLDPGGDGPLEKKLREIFPSK